MSGRLTPPLSELLSLQCAASASNNCDNNKDSTGLWRNFLENPTTVQFDHRAVYQRRQRSTAVLFLSSWRGAMRLALPPSARITTTAFAMANVQIAFCVSTLLYLVPVPLAAAHRAGSVGLLTAAIHVLLAGAVVATNELGSKGGRSADNGGEKPDIVV